MEIFGFLRYNFGQLDQGHTKHAKGGAQWSVPNSLFDTNLGVNSEFSKNQPIQ